MCNHIGFYRCIIFEGHKGPTGERFVFISVDGEMAFQQVNNIFIGSGAETAVQRV